MLAIAACSADKARSPLGHSAGASSVTPYAAAGCGLTVLKEYAQGCWARRITGCPRLDVRTTRHRL